MGLRRTAQQLIEGVRVEKTEITPADQMKAERGLGTRLAHAPIGFTAEVLTRLHRQEPIDFLTKQNSRSRRLF